MSPYAAGKWKADDYAMDSKGISLGANPGGGDGEKFAFNSYYVPANSKSAPWLWSEWTQYTG
jgi:hypothetical protein